MPRRSQIYRGREREIVYRMLIDILHAYHSGYSHVNEPFGTGVETLLIAACVALGDLEGKPFCASKVAAYLGVPRTTVIRKLEKLEKVGGLVYRTGRHYRVREQLLNSPSAKRTFDKIRIVLDKSFHDLSFVDQSPARACDSPSGSLNG